MEAGKDISPLFQNTKDKMVQILSLTCRDMYFIGFLKHFLEKKYV